MNKKKIFTLPIILVSILILALCGCNINQNKTSITINDNYTYYQFKAKFNRNKTERIKQYLNNNLVDAATISFDNNYINETIVLNDDTEFYLKTSPGRISVRFNKKENSEAAYEKVKQLCEVIKQGIDNTK